MHWVAAPLLADYVFALSNSWTGVPTKVASEYTCQEYLSTNQKYGSNKNKVTDSTVGTGLLRRQIGELPCGPWSSGLPEAQFTMWQLVCNFEISEVPLCRPPIDYKALF